MNFVNPKNPLRSQAPGAKQTAAPRATPVVKKIASKEQEDLFEPQGAGGVFNPRKAGSTSERMYDSRGEMNAVDNRDALAQAAYLVNNVMQRPGFGKQTRQASLAENESMRKMIKAAASDPSGAGMRVIAQELSLPIKAFIDYNGWIRQIFRTRTIAQGELFRIPTDIRSSASEIGQDGRAIPSRAHLGYIQPTMGKIVAFTEVDMMELYQGNYDVLDRMQDTAKQEIMLKEDLRGLALLNRISQIHNPVSTFSTLSLAVLENLRYQVERHRLIVDKFLINRAEVADMQISMSGSVDPVTQREWNLSGYVGKFLGTNILTCAGQGAQEVLPAGTVYAVVAPDYLGEMGILAELSSMEYNGLVRGETSKGFAFVEMVGFGAPGARGVAKALQA